MEKKGLSDEKYLSIVKDFKEIIYCDEFKIKQNEFLYKECKIFEDSEENKFEYTKIFEDYQAFIEELLFTKIINLHQDFDITQFVEKLKQENENGNNKDTELTQLLLSFTDFENFKEIMLEAKKNNLFMGPESQQADDIFAFENIKKMLNQKDLWVKTNSDEKNKHFQFKHKNIKSMFLMNAQLDDISIEKFKNHVWNLDKRIEMFKNPQTKDTKPPKNFECLYKYNPNTDKLEQDLLKLNGDGYMILYYELNFPVVSNRDFLVFYRFNKQVSESETMYMMKGLDLNKEQDQQILTKIGKDWQNYKVKNDKKLIRGIYNRFYWIQDKGDYREYNAIVEFDMQFYIPEFVINYILGKGFNVMFKNGMKQLKEQN